MNLGEAMQRKPYQQQTISIRISESMRDFLERSKKVISSEHGESVSTSDVARILLESAKDDRLDFRLDVANLQEAPTESLVAIRIKWQQGQALSRAEWIFLSRYVRVACEELSENPAMPEAGSYIVVLEAVLAVRALRADLGAGLDRYYLENLDVPDDLPHRADEQIQSWDCAFKDLDTSDYVVGQLWGRVGSAYLLGDQVRARMDCPATVKVRPRVLSA